MKKIFVVSLAFALTSCSAKLLTPSENDASRGASKFPGLTAAELVSGKAMYEQKCTLCHGAKKPTAKSEDGWRRVVPEMAGKSKRKGKGEISAADQELILKYLITMGRK